MAGEYQSSEELQRHNADKGVFADAAADKPAVDVTEKTRIIGALDKYIDLHNSTASVRAEAKKNDRIAEYQLDLSADIVEILEKIKNELR